MENVTVGKFVLVVPSSATKGRDDEYNDWYDNRHIHDLLAIPGVKSGRRFVASAASPMAPPANYLAMYEIESDDPAAVMAELNRRSAEGVIPITDAIDLTTAQLWVFEETLSVG